MQINWTYYPNTEITSVCKSDTDTAGNLSDHKCLTSNHNSKASNLTKKAATKALEMDNLG